MFSWLKKLILKLIPKRQHWQYLGTRMWFVQRTTEQDQVPIYYHFFQSNKGRRKVVIGATNNVDTFGKKTVFWNNEVLLWLNFAQTPVGIDTYITREIKISEEQSQH